MERRLSAVLSADIVGYSRLMGANEVGTLTALNARRGEVWEPAIGDFNGRVVKLTGDGLLAEFASVVGAVECAARIQQEMRERNSDLPEDRRIELRIGINLGDIIVQDDDIYGDGVNVAARLEGVAQPGGIASLGALGCAASEHRHVVKIARRAAQRTIAGRGNIGPRLYDRGHYDGASREHQPRRAQGPPDAGV